MAEQAEGLEGSGLRREIEQTTLEIAASSIANRQAEILESRRLMRVDSQLFAATGPSSKNEQTKFANLGAHTAQKFIDGVCEKFGLTIETRRLVGEELVQGESVYKLKSLTITKKNPGSGQDEALSLESWEKVRAKGERPRL